MLLMNVKPALDEGEEKIFSIHKIITETIDRYPFSFNQKNLMHWKDQGANDFQIKGKAILITHILFNLIKNALYYIEKAGKGEITISLKPGDKFNTLYVKDTGTGMPPEVVGHVFDRFFSRTPHGAGIGLTYCKMAMETFNGNITCQSVDGEYTLFTLTFPAKFKDV
jgi:signal transduction histidine kinase